MSKIRKLLIIFLAVCMTVCVAFALVACGEKPGPNNGNNPGFTNPDDPGPDDGTFKGNYVIMMQSQGGLPLSGVRIDLKKDGAVVDSGRSQEDGKISLTLTPDVYEIVIDKSSIPAGYTLADGNQLATKKDEPEVTIKFNSSVITSTAPAGTNYKKGDVMYDFTFWDAVDDTEYSLAKTLKTKKAVVINLWGTRCDPCTTEFPALQKAYEKYSNDLELFALSSYTPAQGIARDSKEKIAQFKKDGGYTFPMGVDHTENDNKNPNIYTMFTLTGYPTTIIVDRYGVIAYRLNGSNPNEAAWESLFSKYTSDNYTQDVNPDDGADKEIEYEPRPKELVSPDSAAIEEAINTKSAQGFVGGFNFAEENLLAWPWVIESDGTGNKYLSASNKAAGPSYAAVNFSITLAPLQGIEFKFKADTRSSNNGVYLIMDGKIYWSHFLSSNGWQTVQVKSLNERDLYYSRNTHTLNVTLIYEKNEEVAGDTEIFIDDIRLFSVPDELGNTEDYSLSVVDGQELVSVGGTKKYTGLEGKIVEENNLLYYTYTDESGTPRKSLLVTDILELTPWTDLHIGKYHIDIEAEGGTYSILASLYNITGEFLTYWGTNENGDYDRVLYDSDYKIFTTFNLQGFSDSGHIPVTTELKAALIEFTKAVYNAREYEKVEGLTSDEWYEDQWLELCFYFRHYGDNHSICYETYNPVDGLSYDYALSFSMDGNDKKDLAVSITKPLNYYAPNHMEEAGGGVKYKFTPDKNGVYAFYSSYTYNAAIVTDPQIRIIDFTTGEIYTADDERRNEHLLLRDENGEYVINHDEENGDEYVYNFNFYVLVPLYVDHEYGFAVQMGDPSTTGDYTMTVECVGDSAAMTVNCVIANGFSEFVYDENGDIVYDSNGEAMIRLIATPVALDPTSGDDPSSRYYRLNNNGSLGDTVYIDLVNYNYFGLPIEEMNSFNKAVVENGKVVRDKDGNIVYETEKDEDGNDILGEDGKPVLKKYSYFSNIDIGEKDEEGNAITDYTQYIEDLIEQSKLNEDWQCGLTVATEKLVRILTAAIREDIRTLYWEQFAVYRLTYSI